VVGGGLARPCSNLCCTSGGRWASSCCSTWSLHVVLHEMQQPGVVGGSGTVVNNITRQVSQQLLLYLVPAQQAR
jgi:hypothetical protein